MSGIKISHLASTTKDMTSPAHAFPKEVQPREQGACIVHFQETLPGIKEGQSKGKGDINVAGCSTLKLGPFRTTGCRIINFRVAGWRYSSSTGLPTQTIGRQTAIPESIQFW